MDRLLQRAFFEPLDRLAEQIMRVVPALVIVVTILVIGGALAFLARHLTFRVLSLVKFDRLVGRTALAGAIERTGLFRSPSEFGARVVQGAIWVFIVLFALAAAGTPMTDELVARFVSYVPDVLTAVLVLLLGSAVSQFLARSALLAAVNAQWAGARLIAGGVRLILMSLAVVVALEQLRIGQTALLVSFAIVFSGVAIAVAIAFGLGARDLAKEWLESKLGRPGTKEKDTFRHL